MSRHRERPYLTDRAIKAQIGSRGNRTPPGRAQKPSFATSGSSIRPVFFDLHIYEMQKGKPENEWPHAQRLIANHKYVIVITGGLDGTTLAGNLRPQGIIIEETIKLQIQLPPEIQKAIMKPVDEYTLSYPVARTFKRRLMITMPINVATGSLTFYLAYQEHENTAFSVLGRRVAPVQVSSNNEDKQLFEHCQIRSGLPAGTALLWIDAVPTPSPTAPRQLKLRGWSSQGTLLEEIATLDTLVSVARFQRNEDDKLIMPPEDIINNMRRFSRTFSSAFIDWLLQIYQSCTDKEQFSLILVDNTTLEIPWEMLELEPGKYTYLGAIAQIARWLPFKCFAQKRWLKVKKVQHTGKVISYLDQDLGNAKVQAEHQVLQKLYSHFYQTLEDLEIRMRQPLEQVGLVYIGCHGLDGNTLQATAQKPSDILKALSLEMLTYCAEPLLTIFANACESARIIREGRLDRGSFVEGFLTHCAGGFIGTLAAVDVQTASEIASAILTAATRGEDIKIPTTLRHLRRQAVDLLQSLTLLPRNQKEKELYRVLDTFMYVYYGNPLAHLSLQSSATQQDALTNTHACPISPGQNEQEGA